MGSTIRRSVAAALLGAGLTLCLSAGQAQAQCQGGGRQQGGQQQGGLRQFSGQQQAALQQYALQQYALQQYALQQQQQYALTMALRRQQQEARRIALQQQQPQQGYAAVTPRPAIEFSGSRPPAPEPPSSEDVAAQKLKTARYLLDDAAQAQRDGDSNLAARLRGRAGERLREIVSRYSGTNAADQAREMLDTLDG